LNLALVEQQQTLHAPKPIDLNLLLDELLDNQMARITRQNIQINKDYTTDAIVIGELFLLRQAINNLLDNALDFTPRAGVIGLCTYKENDQLILLITNQGEPIPDYAFARLTERFFSLPRPGTGKKSTGLGLNFVQEVMDLHNGRLELRNTHDGVAAVLSFPSAL
jgi:two-component system, OmpR family, sensor histidine kinase CreC